MRFSGFLVISVCMATLCLPEAAQQTARLKAFQCLMPLMQGDRLEFVFGGAIERAGAVVGQKDRRAVGAKQRPEL